MANSKVKEMSPTKLADMISKAIASNEHHTVANWLCDRIGTTDVICVQFSAWLPTAVKDSDGEFKRTENGKVLKQNEFKNRKVYIGVRDDGQCTLFQHYYPKSVSAGKIPDDTTHHTVANVSGILVAADLAAWRKLTAYMNIPSDIVGKSPEHTLQLYHGKVTSWIKANASLLTSQIIAPPTSGNANAERGVRIAFEL